MLPGGFIGNEYSLKYCQKYSIKIKYVVRKVLVHFFYWKKFILHDLIWNLYKDAYFWKFILEIFVEI